MSRRAFLKAGGLTGMALVIGIRGDGTLLADPATAGPFRPNKWLSIDAGGRATLTIAGSEMGQGIRTSLPMILADELEVAWEDVALVPARLGPDFKGLGTGGSDSVSSGWMQLRQAGAAAREMLVAAAAEAWRVPPAECRAEQGAIVHGPSGRRLGYGSLVAGAARQPLPERPRLKDASQFRLIGQRVKRVDGPAIVDGSARYGLDTRVPGMRVAAVQRCPVPGGRALRWDESRARAVGGVRAVVRISSGVAVVADDTWSAFQGRDALDVTWDEGPNRAFDSASFRERLKAEAEQAGYPSRNDGDAPAALARASRRLDAVYEYPFHAHATLEPMNGIAHVHGGRCEIVAPTQNQGRAQALVAERLGLKPDAVSVEITLLGGGFGRRLAVDYVVEAAEISRACGRPVQVVWTRADDMQHGHFHPASAHRMAAALDAAGRPAAWLHRKAGSLLSLYPPTEKDLKDPAYLQDSSWGAYDIPYAIPNVLTEYRYVPSPVTSGPWRAVYSPPCTFARESFLDELAQAAGRDPLAYRLELLEGERELKVGMLRIDRERYRHVLSRAAREAGWDRPLPRGDGRRWGRGIAGNVYAGQTHVAHVAEVSVGQGGDLRVHRVVCAIDAGLAVNPLGIEAQVESGILFGLSAAIRGEITWRAGRVQQSSYADYPVMRMRDAPAVEVHILEGASEPYGMGEPPVPPVAPAVLNAVFAATGRRIRRLPLRAEDLA